MIKDKINILYEKFDELVDGLDAATIKRIKILLDQKYVCDSMNTLRSYLDYDTYATFLP